MQGILDDLKLQGIIPRIISYTFDYINDISQFNDSIQFIVKISIFEIYNEKIRDLIELNRQNLQIREDKKRGIYVEDLSEHSAESSRDVLNIIKFGMENRAVNSTNMNDQSSRSHSIVLLNIRQTNTKDLSVKTGKLYLVDLAGSEKISKSGATGVVLDEAKAINKSLTTLGIVINSLTDGKNGHIPYRESKLTRVLQESLGGNSRTCLIITCSPSMFNEPETLSTLRFGLRAKKVKNNAKVNKEFSIQELKNQVNTLEGQMNYFKDRIYLLEDFLMRNGLPIPNEGDLESKNLKAENEPPVIISNTSSISKASNPPVNQTLTYANITEINGKYIEVLGLVNDLEFEKEELENKLKEALEFINEVKLEKQNKEIIITEIERLKKNSDSKVDEMHDEIIKYKKYLEKTKIDLTLISEVDCSMEIGPTILNDTIKNTKPDKEFLEEKIFDQEKELIKITDEIENTNEIFLEIEKEKDYQLKDEIEIPNEICLDSEKDSCFKSQKNERESTYPSTVINNGRTGSLCESNIIISLNNNNTRDLLENFSHDQVIVKNQAVEELISKLKGYSEKYPEIANVVDEFKQKINTESKKNSREFSNSLNKSGDKLNENTSNSRENFIGNGELPNSKETMKTSVLSDLNSKVERVRFIK